MKKAKIMLTAIVVMSVVGTALAFTSNKAKNGDLICATAAGHVKGDGFCVTRAVQGSTFLGFCTNATAPNGTACDAQITVDAKQ